MKHFVLNRSCNHPMCLLLTLLMSMSAFTSHAQVAINETNFPDENFRNYLLAQSYGQDGELTDEEINGVTEINVDKKEISTLKGIEYFTALRLLYCDDNQLTALDVSKNTALFAIHCSKNQLTALDVSKNMALWSLSCDDNQLTALDVSKNTALESLSCGNNQLKALDVSKNTALWSFYCSKNQLTALDVSKNTALESLYCQYNQLTALDVSKNTALERLYCRNNQLTALDLSKNTVLEMLDCSSNQLTTLDVSNNTALTELNCSRHQINGAAMDALISSLPEKTGENAAFHVIYNSWEGPDGNDCTKEQVAAALAKGWQPMEYKNFEWVPYEGSGEPVAINETNFPDEKFRNYLLAQSYGADGVLTGNEINNVTYISVYNKEISSLKGIEHFTALTKLNCSNNQLTALDLSGNPALTELDCYRNQIKGAAMDALISSLPTITGEKAPFHVVYYSSWETEGNDCTKEQVAVAIAKGWQPMENIDWNWVPYEGSIEPVAINETNFPDENFRNYLLAQSYGVDGVLTNNEIKGVTEIDVDEKGISSLKGIEHFTALKRLYCSINQLTALDVSKNTALLSLSCYINQLTDLDVSNNTALYLLDCPGNQLTALDVSNNTALNSLDCSRNQLTALDVSKNTTLYSLDCSGNQLTALDVSKNTTLYSLKCSGNQLTDLDVSNNIVLTDLWCSTNQLTALDVSKNTALKVLYCYKNQLTALDVSNNTALTKLYCSENPLTALDLSRNTALIELECQKNLLAVLDVSKNTALEDLYCSENQLTALDVSKNTALEVLYCYKNQLTALDFSENTALRALYCNENQLTTLDFSENTALIALGCYRNQIKGTAMDALISSLPNKTGESPVFRVIYNDEETIEGNVCTKEQVAAAIAKGWEPMEYKDEEWVPYEGSDSTDHINTAVINHTSQPVYTLSGQRVTMPKKGINIVDGKKIIVR